MTAQNKPKIEEKVENVIPGVEVEAQDEIDQIMNEIEELQQEMNASGAPVSAPEEISVAAPVQVHSTSPPPANVAPVKVKEEEARLSAIADLEKEILREFSGGGDEPWLEETLAELKSEPSATGAGILDKVPDPSFPEVSESIEESDHEMQATETQATEAQEADVSELSEVEDALLNKILEPLGEEKVSSQENHDSDFADQLEVELAAEQEAVEKIIQEGRKASNHPTSASENSLTSPSSLAMTVQGRLNLRLNYGSDGEQHVLISFSEQIVQIQLANGTEFRVPIGSNSTSKKK